MKLSVRGEYALRAMQVLARDYEEDDSVVRIQEISENQNIPKRFLEQILNDLKSAGVVQSKRGVAGGYRLKRNPNQITLAEIIRHIEGPLAPVSCVSEKYYEKCAISPPDWNIYFKTSIRWVYVYKVVRGEDGPQWWI